MKFHRRRSRRRVRRRKHPCDAIARSYQGSAQQAAGVCQHRRCDLPARRRRRRIAGKWRQSNPSHISRRSNHADIHGRCRRGRGGVGAVIVAAGIGARRRRPAARQRTFQDLVQRGGAAPLRSGDALSALVLVPARARGLRGGAQGRSGLRHGALGHRARAARQSAQRDPAAQPGARPRRHPEGQGDRRQDRARARLHRRAHADVRRSRQAQPCPAHPRVPRRAGEDRGQISGRRRGADRLRHHAQHVGRHERQDLRPAEQGRRDPGADLPAPAAASGRHPLPDPPLRLSGDRREGPRRRQPLRQGRAGRPARPAHAVAHLYPRRLLEGVDRLQHRLGEGREGGEVGRQLPARPGLHGLRPPPARPGQAGARRHGRDDAGDRVQGDRARPPTTRWRPRRRAMRSSAATGTAPRNCRSGRATSAS